MPLAGAKAPPGGPAQPRDWSLGVGNTVGIEDFEFGSRDPPGPPDPWDQTDLHRWVQGDNWTGVYGPGVKPYLRARYNWITQPLTMTLAHVPPGTYEIMAWQVTRGFWHTEYQSRPVHIEFTVEGRTTVLRADGSEAAKDVLLGTFINPDDALNVTVGDAWHSILGVGPDCSIAFRGFRIKRVSQTHDGRAMDKPPQTGSRGPVYRVLQSRVIYHGELGVGLPCVVQTPNGDILVQFNTGKDFWPTSRAYLMRSADRGETWGEPQLIVESRLQDGAIHTNVGITCLSNGTLIQPFAEARLRPGWQGFPEPRHPDTAFAQVYVILSTDHGRSWSGWIPVNRGGPMFSPHGRVVEMPDGRLLLTAWGFNHWAPKDMAIDWSNMSYSGYFTSTDGGQTWWDFRKLGVFGETSLVRLTDGATLIACLKQNATRQTFTMRSEDGGRTWTEPKPTGFAGKNASMHLSPAGIPLILCSPVVTEEDRPGFLYYSLDHGETWQEGLRLIEPIPPKHAFAYGVSAQNLAEGKMLVVFYGSDPDKKETGSSPWTTTTNYLAANVVGEMVE